MIPILLYGPPLLGVGHLDVKTVAAVTMVQVFAAAMSGMLVHRRHRSVNPRLAWSGGLAMAAGSLSGALASKLASDFVLLLVFAVMVTAAVGLLFVPTTGDIDVVLARQREDYSRPLTALIGAGVGLAAGLVGAGGAFLLAPLLLVVVGVPVRVTIGSSLAITAIAATAGMAGKLATGQVPLWPALAVVAGAVPGAHAGALVSRRLSEAVLRRALGAIVTLTMLRVWWDVLGR